MVVGVLVLATVSGCGSATAGDNGAAAPVSARSTVAATQQRCPVDGPRGTQALPAVTLRCLTGGSAVTLTRLPARPFVINLWASWCVPCRREAPRLAAAAAAVGRQVGFLGVNTADARGAALAFLHRYGIHYPQLSDPNSDILHRLGAPGLPVTLAVNAAGRLVYQRIGEISTGQLAAALHVADPGIVLDGKAGS